MNVAQLREAARLAEDFEPRTIVSLLELGSMGCQLRIGSHAPHAERREFRITPAGTSVDVGAPSPAISPATPSLARDAGEIEF